MGGVELEGGVRAHFAARPPSSGASRERPIGGAPWPPGTEGAE